MQLADATATDVGALHVPSTKGAGVTGLPKDAKTTDVKLQPLGAVSVRMPPSAMLPLTEAQAVTVAVELGTPPPTNPSAADAVPALQGVQTEGTLPPCCVMAAVPAAHLVQADEPTAGAKEPAAQ